MEDSPGRRISASNGSAHNPGDIYLTIQIDDSISEKLNCVREFTRYFSPETSIGKVLETIAKRQVLFENPEDIRSYALYKARKSTRSEKYKFLNDERLLRKIKLKANVLYLRKRETIALRVFIQNFEKLQVPQAIVSNFLITDTIQTVLDRITQKENVRLPTENCSLFLPGLRSKQGHFLEPTSRLVDLGFENAPGAAVILKHRDKEEVILTVLIEDFVELRCARTVTAVFNLNWNVKQTLGKIARKGNVFIEDISKYKLVCQTSKKMHGNQELHEFGLSNFDTLMLRKRSRFFSPFWDSEGNENAFVLCERMDDKSGKRSIYRFYSEEHEKLYWSLSVDSFSDEITPSASSESQDTTTIVVIDDVDHDFSTAQLSQNVDPAVSPDISETVLTTSSMKTPSRTPSLVRIEQTGDTRVVQKTPSAKELISIPLSVFRTPSSNNLLGERTMSKGLIRVASSELVFGPSSNNKESNEGAPAAAQPPRRNRPGKLPSKTKAGLSLLRLYYDENRYCTLAVNNQCTVRDVCRLFGEMNGTSTPISLYESKKDATISPIRPLRKLAENETLMTIKKCWIENSYVFLVKQDELETTGSKSQPQSTTTEKKAPTSPEMESMAIPSTIRRSKDVEGMLNGDTPHRTLRSSVITRPKGNSLPKAIFIDYIEQSSEYKWIDAKKINKIERISEGAFAKVYKGVYFDRLVAIKTLIGSVTPDIIRSFKAECDVLSSVSSPHLVTFFGACVQTGDRLSMIMEFCPNESLHNYLKHVEDSTKLLPLTWSQIVKWLLQTVKGVNVLHSMDPPLLHRDIKSLNLLLDDSWNIKVCDFGLSRFRTMTNLSSLVEVRGTMAYCPPEIYDEQIFSTHSDVYSLGMVIWELVSTRVLGYYEAPFSQFEDITYDFQILVRAFKEKLRPPIPQGTPKILKKLIEDCWNHDVDLRPSCLSLINQLERLSRALSTSGNDETSAVILHQL
eukprot:TRINITY_DN1359_c0_g4_i1.p1 TRINITY_DN1359_c0_g4~~TRINITY_DN1359_c0_g4_i1.p1  ORF type:complete len:965 (+),score=241.91 TRINITY_DN1359_c0_g4_i1:2400-5294(+)